MRHRWRATKGLEELLWDDLAGTPRPPGNWSSQRHWHSHEDELVYVPAGELVLIEDDCETLLRAGDCAVFPKNTGNGRHMTNRSDETAVYLEVGSRMMDDMTTCSDIDMKSANADGRFVHKDGTPYPDGQTQLDFRPIRHVHFHFRLSFRRSGRAK